MNEKSDQPPIPQNDITDGTFVVYVRNTQLAACMVAVGIPLRLDPPYTVKEMPNGDIITTWNFESENPAGTIKALDVMKAWKDDISFGEKNPTHPFTFAMHAIKNYRQMVDHIHCQKPWVAYMSQTGLHTIWVIKGTAKEQDCIDSGLKRTGDHVEVAQATH